MTTCPRCGAQVNARWFCPNCGARLPDQDSATAARRARRRRRWGLILAGIATAVMILCVMFLVIASIPDPVALVLCVVAAVVPAAVYSWLVLRLDRYEAEPRRAILSAFGWGAVGAVLFSALAELVFAGVLSTTVGPDAADFLTVAIGAPVIEEAFKGGALLIILWFFRREFDNVLDGLVYGALIGLGFAMTENIFYFGEAYREDGAAGLGELFVARAVVSGLGHAQYTGTTGAAIGWARSRYGRGVGQYVAPVAGYVLAVLQHFLWNTGAVVIAGLKGEDLSAISLVLLMAPFFILPAVIVLYLVARTASRRELQIMREMLHDEAARGVLTPAEYQVLTTDKLRKAALTEAERRGGKALERRLRRFFQVAADLAFRRYHLRRGELLKPGQQAPDDRYREELAALRAELAAAGLTIGAAHSA
ncbi:MAG TPA: PrsW family glutamic-type intramembrane protease [Thermomicrobiales bacterium]